MVTKTVTLVTITHNNAINIPCESLRRPQGLFHYLVDIYLI